VFNIVKSAGKLFLYYLNVAKCMDISGVISGHPVFHFNELNHFLCNGQLDVQHFEKRKDGVYAHFCGHVGRALVSMCSWSDWLLQIFSKNQKNRFTCNVPASF
jgi:hypothetical protein